ncbi:MAG: DUF4286 family protein [Chitinophagaceae bacterium]|nr:DUF4286 family protein [Chitinophagaceae bacterium]
MIIYNVTIKVDPSIAREWLEWLKKEHIPDVINTGCFTHAATLRLMEVDESDGITYAIQYHAKDMEDYKRYIDKHSNEMRKKGTGKWGNKFIAFRTVMEVVN